MRGALTSQEDPYRTLQVEPNADLEAIHAAYRRLARLYHPDLNPRPEAAERMRAINSAYRLLSDPRLRAAYDAQRYLRPAPVAVSYGVPRPQRRQVVVPPPQPPTPLERRVDRIVAVLGVLLLVLIGIYAAVVIPRNERAFQSQLRGERPPAATVSVPQRDIRIPQRLSSDVGLRSFPGTVVVPPSSLPPFRDLPILRIDATGQGIARYAVYYGDLTTGVATITGLIGRASFDASAPRVVGCAPDATYCAGIGPGQGQTDPPGLELFRPAHLVSDDPAFASHRVCCNGVFWTVSWYDPGTNMSYTIDLSRNVALQYGSSTVEDDVAAARSVGALASQLVRLP